MSQEQTQSTQSTKGLITIFGDREVSIPIKLTERTNNESSKSYSLCFNATISIFSCERTNYPPLIIIDQTESGKFSAVHENKFIKDHQTDSRSKTAYSFRFNGKPIFKNAFGDLFCLLNSKQILIRDHNHSELGKGYLFVEKDDTNDANTYFITDHDLRAHIISAEVVVWTDDKSQTFSHFIDNGFFNYRTIQCSLGNPGPSSVLDL